MTTVDPALDVDWDSLKPPCEAALCKPVNPGELVARHKHFHPVNCNLEGFDWWICRECYDQIKTLALFCVLCRQEATIYEQD